MAKELFIVLILSVSVYVPMAGGINGSPQAAIRKHLQTGDGACGPAYQGLYFELPREVESYGLPTTIHCRERGGAVTNHHLDIALVSPNIRGDLKTAFAWGRRRISVRVYRPISIGRRRVKEE